MSIAQLKTRQRRHYPYRLDYRLRWNDNDMYQHMNNSMYNTLFDSIINDYLIKYCGIIPASSPQYGLAVHSHTDFISPISYPSVAELGLRVIKMGTASVTYELAVFEKDEEGVKAVGEFVHVFVDRETGRPVKASKGTQWRTALEKIHLGPVEESVSSKL